MNGAAFGVILASGGIITRGVYDDGCRFFSTGLVIDGEKLPHVLLRTTTATMTAMLLGVDRVLIRAGLFGFNGGLVAIALLYFLQPDALTWGCVIFAAACSTIVMAAMLTLLKV